MNTFRDTTSITSLLRDESERRLQSLFQELRAVDVSRAEAIKQLNRMSRSKGWWIQTFSSGPKKRQQHEIDTARLQLAVLVQLHDHLRKKEAARATDPGT